MAPQNVSTFPGFQTRLTPISDHLLPVSAVTALQEISNRTHGPRIPKKPEYLIARLQLTKRGPLGFGPMIHFWWNYSKPMSMYYWLTMELITLYRLVFFSAINHDFQLQKYTKVITPPPLKKKIPPNKKKTNPRYFGEKTWYRNTDVDFFHHPGPGGDRRYNPL